MNYLHIDFNYFSRQLALRQEVKKRSKLREKDIKAIVQRVVDTSSEARGYFKNGSVAHISVQGILLPSRSWLNDWYEIPQTSYRDIIDNIAKAEADEDIVDIYFDFNTPGGYVEISDEAADAIGGASKKTTAVCSGLCASAGIKLASQADTIVSANRSTQFGSIGTVVDVVDYSGWEEEVGIKSYSVTNTDSPDKRPDISTAKGRDVIRAQMDGLQEVFDLYLEEGRSGKGNFSMENVRSLKGGLVTAKRALELGLIDKIGVDELLLVEGGGSDSLQTNNKNGGSMGLKELLAENPEAKKQYDEEIAAANTASSELVKAESGRIGEILSAAGVAVPENAQKAIDEGRSKSEYIVSAFEAGELTRQGGEEPAPKSGIPAAAKSKVPTFAPSSTARDDLQKSGDVFDHSKAEGTVNELFSKSKNGDK
jgi:ClpP class serine protease